MSLASHFAHQRSFTLDFSLLSGAKLSYPFLADFLTGIMVRLGSSWQIAFLVPTAVLLLSFIRLSMSLVQRLTGSLRAAWLHIAIVLFSGSAWGWIEYLRDIPNVGWESVKTIDYSNLAEKHLHFANFLTSHLLPQRSYLFGICMLLAMLIVLHEWLHTKSQGILLTSAALLALLPFIHVHTFFVGLAVWCCAVAFSTYKDRGGHSEWLIGVALIVIGALPQLIWQFAHAYTSTFTSFHVGWMTPPGMNMIVFWMGNLGIALPLMVGGVYVALRSKGTLLNALVIVGAGLFIAGNMWLFQPNDWDNMKFFTYAYFFLMIPVAGQLAAWTRAWYSACVVAMVMVLLTATGALALYREKFVSYQFLSANDIELGQYINENLVEDAVILTADRHNHPVPLLTGRPIVMGYRGWLWSYGINYAEQEKDVIRMAKGADTTEVLLATYHVKYVVIQQGNFDAVQFNIPYYAAHYTLKATIGSWLIYEI
jgi:hypothetical protein